MLNHVGFVECWNNNVTQVQECFEDDKTSEGCYITEKEDTKLGLEARARVQNFRHQAEETTEDVKDVTTTTTTTEDTTETVTETAASTSAKDGRCGAAGAWLEYKEMDDRCGSGLCSGIVKEF